MSHDSEAPRRSSIPSEISEVVPRLGRSEPREMWVIRLCFLTVAALLAAIFRPVGVSGGAGAVAGVLVGLVVIAVELRIRGTKPMGVIGAAAGMLIGTLCGALASFVVSLVALSPVQKSPIELLLLLCFGYLGLVSGTRMGLDTPRGALQNLFGRATVAEESGPPAKLLDTSVLIDGRIADVCEAHFLDGPLLVPQFVLHELQLVADSADTLRRQRGRRGLEVLQRMQKMPQLEVRVLEDGAVAAEVDQQLVALARRLRAKIVTNDFNLNRVASVQGIGVLNVNELANALRPAVLPGESMRVFVLREGKEAGQGVAYLEDGTMVVVDGARRVVNKTVDIVVTSVHQTPAGKMIFGRLDDRADGRRPVQRQAPTAGRTLGPSSAEHDPGSDLPKSGPH